MRITAQTILTELKRGKKFVWRTQAYPFDGSKYVDVTLLELKNGQIQYSYITKSGYAEPTPANLKQIILSVFETNPVIFWVRYSAV